MSLNNVNKDFLYAIEVELEEYFTTGMKGKNLKKFFGDATDEALQEMKNEVWRALRTLSDIEQAQRREAATPILTGYTRLARGLELDILHELKRTGSPSEIERRIKDRLQEFERYARTWTFTGQGAINQAERINTALKRGYTHFTLTGPAPEREWCREHIDKTFSYEEIVKMDNGQRLPVLFYRGGYNCRHIWLPVRK